CQTLVQGTGEGKLAPQAILHYVNAPDQTHSETFQIETTAPTITFSGVSIQLINGVQHLVVRATASDDIDINYVGFSVIGLRASELRAAGGVIQKASQKAFATTTDTHIYPLADGQTEFSVAVPVTTNLSADAISSDGVVLVDASVLDASGNQTSFSTIAFTGTDVTEDAVSLQVAPTQLVFSNALESATIIPSVEFQFRGLTALPGIGTGVSYSSSHPNLITVTAAGLVFPLQETGAENVSIKVSYPGLPDRIIPVKADFTKIITAIQAQGLNADGRYVLNRLNTFFDPPKVKVVFNDGSTSDLTSRIGLNYTLGPGTSGIIESDAKGRLLSRAIIPPSTPVQLHIRLTLDPAIATTVHVVAEDALPQITLELPTTVEANTNLSLNAQALDDVAIQSVVFTMDGAAIGSRNSPPYTVDMAIPKELVNRKLNFQASATDSAGQTVLTAVKTVNVTSKIEHNVPELKIERPSEMQRIVENTPFVFQASRDLGIKDLNDYEPAISYVEFFIDGKKVSESYFPIFESRDKGFGEKSMFEVWKAEGRADSISTNETSLSVYGLAHGLGGGEKQTNSSLIRLIKNAAPSVKITNLVDGNSVSVGQTVLITLEFSDDTLALGTTLELTVDGKTLDRFIFQNKEENVDAITARSSTHTFKLRIAEEFLGETLTFRASVTDFHQKIALSQPVDLLVRGDQPPTVSVSHPVQGANFVAGVPISLRAEAVDDLGVKRIDFYVDGRLVGSDASRPYSLEYETPSDIPREQTLVVHAIAV
ncbi:MAG TPA: Ig-like domain-containing protein, partial [Gammaproteobacteria bacterium]